MKNFSYKQAAGRKIAIFALATLSFFTSAGSLTARGDKCVRQRAPMTVKEYVAEYGREAQRQQKKYGIPASITLAQGLLESGNGSSYLAVVANNHFGIKAYRDWAGPVVRCDDDAKREPFCKFASVEKGYEYHSFFLRNNPRYNPLFKLDVTDYAGWAEGLKRCGYATSRSYAKDLIRIIETNHLDVYDVQSSNHVERPHKVYLTSRKRGLHYIRCQAGDDLAYISKEFDISRRKLRIWNDLPKKYQLKEGEIIYLERKNSKAAKQHRTHVVKAGESLQAISQMYGIRLKSLMKRNRLESGRVQTGQVLKLR